MSDGDGELLRRTLQNQTQLLEEIERLRQRVAELERERDEARGAARWYFNDAITYGPLDADDENVKHWPWLR